METETVENKKLSRLCWSFWNRCYLGRNYPRRHVKERRELKPYTCYYCKEEHVGVGRIYFLRFQDTTYDAVVCPRCDDLLKGESLRADREEIRLRSLELQRSFDHLLENCSSGVCDVLAAHKELLKDDPDRLRTEFLIELMCGESGLNEYREAKKNRTILVDINGRKIWYTGRVTPYYNVRRAKCRICGELGPKEQMYEAEKSIMWVPIYFTNPRRKFAASNLVCLRCIQKFGFTISDIQDTEPKMEEQKEMLSEAAGEQNMEIETVEK